MPPRWGYAITQRLVHDAIVHRSEAAIREARERRERAARTGIPELPPIPPGGIGDLSPLEEIEWLIEVGLISRDSVEYQQLRSNIAPKIVPISFGAAFGLWAAAVIGWTVKRRAHPPVSVSIEPAGRVAPQRRVWRLSVAHLLGPAPCRSPSRRAASRGSSSGLRASRCTTRQARVRRGARMRLRSIVTKTVCALLHVPRGGYVAGAMAVRDARVVRRGR